MVAIFVVLTFLVLVAADLVVERRRAPLKAPAPLHPFAPQIEAGLFYHPGHTWSQILPSGRVRIGADAFVGGALERVERVEVLVGDSVRRGEPLLAVEAAGQRLVLPAPLSGRIAARNGGLPTHHPQKHWCCEVVPEQLGGEVGGLKIAEQARAWMRGEVERLQNWLAARAPVVPGVAMQDGGELAEGFLRHLDAAAAAEFQTRFVHPS